MKLTPWFSGQTPPVREGWYEFCAPIQTNLQRQRFMAYYRPNQMTFHLKQDEPGYAIACFDQWRGLAKKPSNVKVSGLRGFSRRSARLLGWARDDAEAQEGEPEPRLAEAPLD